ncbi:phosphatase PAP2 family protein [Aggregatimonas sangjinii]|uniref:Phosphatase PAP2 family protein n=1 Tax=Aggregatimonas sangjinii TaxID=2583587 RepID=A0A5B7SR84_9FLAO|nr:phosphatase PAP2 family protein [Aggregatimonas sangjinii]QCW99439.1 phosphatase PAP2 family protein [Aggregatimonas sangjinii]
MKTNLKPELIVLFFAILASNYLQGQQTSNSSSDDTRWDYFKHDIGSIFGGMGYAYSRPVHWQGDDWLTFGAVSAGTVLLYTVDDETSRFFRKRKEDIPQIVSDYGFLYGSPENNYMLTGAVYVTGLALKNEKLRRTGVLLIASASATGFLQQVLKSVTGRARPRSGLAKNYFEPFASDKDLHSFPSGHAILALSNAHAIAKQFKNVWVKSGIYILGSIPALSRIWEGAHWLSDVALSAAISIATVESIDRYLDRRYDEKYNAGAKKVSWNLKFGLGQMGVVIHIH